MTADEGSHRLLLRPEPLDAAAFAPFGAVLAPTGPDGLPDQAGTRAFLGGRGDVIRYGHGQWHAPMVALDAGGDMLMLAFERGKGGDTIEHRLPAAILVAGRPPNGTERP